MNLLFFLSYTNNLYFSQGSRKPVVALCNREGCWREFSDGLHDLYLSVGIKVNYSNNAFCNILCRDSYNTPLHLSYFVYYFARAAQIKDPSLCPIEDLRQCLTFTREAIIDKTGTQYDLPDLVAIFFKSFGAGKDPTTIGDLCEKALENDVDGVLDALCVLGKCFLDDDPQKRGVGLISCDDYDGPTYRPLDDDPPPGYPYCYAVPEEQYTIDTFIPTLMVTGMDYAGGELCQFFC